MYVCILNYSHTIAKNYQQVLQGNMVKRVVAPKCDTPKDKPLVAGRLPAYTPLTAGKEQKHNNSNTNLHF